MEPEFVCPCGTEFEVVWEGYSFTCPDCGRDWHTTQSGDVVPLEEAPDG